VSNFVLDCSVAVCWCFKDQKTPATEALLAQGRKGKIFVPALWHLELSNVLVGHERRKRITAEQLAGAMEFLGTLPVETDEDATLRVWDEILTLARAEKLTTYDATYLELALRKGLPLATKDEDLIKAARRVGVKTLPGS
jgi:predicted nucleic acid-binding protein